METVTIHKAKTELSRLIARACRGEEIVIARGKKPVVRLVALPSGLEKRKPGVLKEKVKCRLLSPVPFARRFSPPAANPHILKGLH